MNILKSPDQKGNTGRTDCTKNSLPQPKTIEERRNALSLLRQVLFETGTLKSTRVPLENGRRFYVVPKMASLAALATRNFTTRLAFI